MPTATQHLDSIHGPSTVRPDTVQAPDTAQHADTVVDSTYSAHAAMLFLDRDPLHKPEPRQADTRQGASWLLLALLVLLVAIGLKFRKSAKYIFLLGKEITNTRRRHNVFDDTVRESSFLLLLNTVTLLSEGLLLYLYLLGGGRPELPGAAACMGVALGYGLFLWAAYGLTGWVFSDADTMRVWVRGHNAATGLLCVVMLPLALAAAADTSIATTVAPVALGAFLVAKLIFIFKGARIFMHGPTSILLFFYYLCSLEIVPLVLAYAAARFLLDAVA